MAARPARLPGATALLHSARALCGRLSVRDASRRHAAHLQPARHWCSGAHRRKVAAASGGAAAGSVLFISPVWPERSSSAAGVRTSDLVASFQERGWAAAFASSSSLNDHTAALAAAGVATRQLPPNREAELESVLAEAQPTAVVFDRFYAEEAFSFRVRELAPSALRILDMQDFHALRAARQRAAEAGAPAADVLSAGPDASSPECLRELAAIHRSDLTLVCSPVELRLLAGHYGVPASKLVLAPFFAPPSPFDPAAASTAAGAEAAAAAPEAVPAPPFEQRKHFLMIGNWRHPPNLDSARWACSEVWPALRQSLPPEHRDAELHLYGAYAAGAAQQLHKPKAGVHLKGFAPSLDIMLQYRVLLAPLRYGAGLKGKVVDSWWHGLPVVTTPVGAEGMTADDAAAEDVAAAVAGQAASLAAARLGPDRAAEGYIWQQGRQQAAAEQQQQQQQQTQQEDWGGLCGGTTAGGIAGAAALLYSDASLWQACQQRGFELLRLLYGRERNLGRVHAAVAAAQQQLEERRRQDFTGSMLWQQQLRATEYFSRWIELKETAAAAQQAQQQ
ncbi:glycosyl transferase [Chlorella sorokiniana]|uniref:Glycosyl transferase n=1 Tax=Chlorella sorokiniana TaxID=3076 RepID=A0A2P6TZT3_CHLSO|nr:glycosyl transferase [Chlorella sorokiniana]|eukprot:PRW59577.1 glycosyl transferase [Chlorella sorokiniana]